MQEIHLNIDLNDLDEFNGVDPEDDPVTFHDAVVTPTAGASLDPNSESVVLAGTNIVCAGNPFKIDLQFIQAVPGDVTSPLYFGVRCTGKGVKGTNVGFGVRVGAKKMRVFCDIVVQRADSTIVFETIPGDGSDSIYLDASESFDIVRDNSGNYFHQLGS